MTKKNTSNSSGVLFLALCYSLVLFAIIGIAIYIIRKKDKTTTTTPSTKKSYSEALLIDSNITLFNFCLVNYSNKPYSMGYAYQGNCPFPYQLSQIKTFKYNSTYDFTTQLTVYSKSGNVYSPNGPISTYFSDPTVFKDIQYYYYVSDSSIQYINDFQPTSNNIYGISYSTFKSNIDMQKSYMNNKLGVYVFNVNECLQSQSTDVTVYTYSTFQTIFQNKVTGLDGALNIPLTQYVCNNASLGYSQSIFVFPI